MKRRQQQLVLGCLEMLTGFGIAVYWILFFYFDMKPVNPQLCYFSFEHSFVASDTLLAGLLVTAGGFLAAGKGFGQTISLPCGGGLVCLGATDVSFNLANGIYTQTVWQTLQNAAVNFWCLGFGLSMIVVLCFWIGDWRGNPPQDPFGPHQMPS